MSYDNTSIQQELVKIFQIDQNVPKFIDNAAVLN